MSTFQAALGAGILKITIGVGLTSNTSRRRRASKEEEVEPRDTIGDIQPAIPVKVHGVLTTRRLTTEEQPIQQTLRVSNVHPPIGVAVISDRVLIDTEKSHLVGRLAGENTEVVMSNHVIDRLTSAATPINITNDFRFCHVNSGIRSLDINLGNNLGPGSRQGHKLGKGENQRANRALVSLAFSEFTFLEPAPTPAAVIFVSRGCSINTDSYDTDTRIGRQADRPALSSNLCPVLRGCQRAINSLAEGQAENACNRFAILAAKGKGEVRQGTI